MRKSVASRLYFEDEEFERIALGALGDKRLLPDGPVPIRIEMFIERNFGITPAYEPLPPSILGASLFSERGIEGVVVSEKLTGWRLSSTLAHEAGHLLLHADFLIRRCRLKASSRVFVPDAAIQRVRKACKLESVGYERSGGYDGDWQEYQANQMIGALLLPRPLVMAALKADGLLVPRGGMGIVALNENRREAASKRLSAVFGVSPAVARYRLAKLLPTPVNGQLAF